MFVINFLAPFQILLSPNFVSHTLDHSRQGDEILEGQGQGWWGRFALYWALLVVFVSVFQYLAKRLAGKNVSEMTYFVLGLIDWLS